MHDGRSRTTTQNWDIAFASCARPTAGLNSRRRSEQAWIYKYLGAIERGERNVTLDNIEKIAAGFGVEAHQLFLFSAREGEITEERITETKIRDLLRQSDAGQQLMWRVLRELAAREGG